MRLICLIENTTVDDKLYNEEGLSLFVEYNSKNYLIDTGLTGRAVDNARRMRLPITELDAVIITHNHSAHIGGIDAIMRLNPKADIYLRAGAKTEHFQRSGLFKNPVGASGGFFRKYAKNLILFNNFSEVTEGFYLTGCETIDESAVNPDKSYFTLDGKKSVPYNYSDESFAVIFPKKKKSEGMIIIGGCFHCGASNILDTVQNLWMDIPILAVIGGFHFTGSNPKTVNCSSDYIYSQCRALKMSGAEKIYACHCTGFKGFDIMDEQLGDKILYLGGGEELDF